MIAIAIALLTIAMDIQSMQIIALAIAQQLALFPMKLGMLVAIAIALQLAHLPRSKILIPMSANAFAQIPVVMDILRTSITVPAYVQDNVPMDNNSTQLLALVLLVLETGLKMSILDSVQFVDLQAALVLLKVWTQLPALANALT
jgi:hypothetical protein